MAEQYGLADGYGDQPVTDEHLEIISRSCCKKWKSLPAHLELEDIVAEDIDKTQKGEREKRHDFLREWKSMKGSKATYKKLIAALLKIKCKDEAEKLQAMEAEKVQAMKAEKLQAMEAEKVQAMEAEKVLKNPQPQQPTQDSASATPSTGKNTSYS